ncbi:MAG: hypothetical protein LBQ47_05830 [Endomicrobium sp.]|jgi:hypothetical protein|nr:hypothetical protein [Endomicrobium sp.]
MKKNIVFLSIALLAVLCAAFYFFAITLTKYKTAELENLVIEKTRSSVRAVIGRINSSIENSDDIGLLADIESLSKLENINSCFILDRENKIIIHNNTSDWNSTRKSEIYDRAVNYDGELVQATPDKDHLLFSAPLAKEYTLLCIISVQKAAETANFWKIKYFTVGALAALAITVLFYFFAKLFIVLPFKRTRKRIEQACADNLKNEKYDEISDLFLTESRKSEQKIALLEKENKSLAEIIGHYFSSFKQDFNIIIALNADNNIIYAYDDTGKILKKDFTKGGNIIETLLNQNFLRIISSATENPVNEIEENDGEFAISAVSIPDGEKAAATIIKAKTV